jgi:GNAT superfamily N-acetyltransferase
LEENALEIKAIKYGDILWGPVAKYAENCSWGAGVSLAKQMKEKEFTDWERVFAAVEDSQICGYCTLAKTDCIPDVDYTPYIGYMFVGEDYRGHRLSQQMIKQALEYAKTLGFARVYLVSGEKGLYEKYGFLKIADKKDFWGREEQIFSIDI